MQRRRMTIDSPTDYGVIAEEYMSSGRYVNYAFSESDEAGCPMPTLEICHDQHTLAYVDEDGFDCKVTTTSAIGAHRRSGVDDTHRKKRQFSHAFRLRTKCKDDTYAFKGYMLYLYVVYDPDKKLGHERGYFCDVTDGSLHGTEVWMDGRTYEVQTVLKATRTTFVLVFVLGIRRRVSSVVQDLVISAVSDKIYSVDATKILMLPRMLCEPYETELTEVDLRGFLKSANSIFHPTSYAGRALQGYSVECLAEMFRTQLAEGEPLLPVTRFRALLGWLAAMFKATTEWLCYRDVTLFTQYIDPADDNAGKPVPFFAGFMSRGQADKLLADECKHTFIFRFMDFEEWADVQNAPVACVCSIKTADGVCHKPIPLESLQRNETLAYIVRQSIPTLDSKLGPGEHTHHERFLPAAAQIMMGFTDGARMADQSIRTMTCTDVVKDLQSRGFVLTRSFPKRPVREAAAEAKRLRAEQMAENKVQ